MQGRLADWLASLSDPSNVVAVSHGIASRVLRGIHLKLDRSATNDLPVVRDAPFHLHADGIEKLALP